MKKTIILMSILCWINLYSIETAVDKSITSSSITKSSIEELKKNTSSSDNTEVISTTNSILSGDFSNYPPALLSRDELDNMDQMKTSVAGKLRLVGNVPFQKLVITTLKNVDIAIVLNNEEYKTRLLEYQGKYAEVFGIIGVRELKFLNEKYNYKTYTIISEKVVVY